MSQAALEVPQVRIPKLTDHKPYAEAAAKLAEITAPLAEARRELKQVEDEIEDRRTNREVVRRRLRDRAVATVLAGRGAELEDYESAFRDLHTRRAEALNKVEVYAEAERQFNATVVMPAFNEAVAKLVRPIREQVYKPLVRGVGLLLVQAMKGMRAVESLAFDLGTANLSSACSPNTLAGPLADDIERVVAELIEDGYLSRDEPLLAGTRFAK